MLPSIDKVKAIVWNIPEIASNIDEDEVMGECGDHSRWVLNHLHANDVPALRVHTGLAGSHMFCLCLTGQGVAVVETTAAQFNDEGIEPDVIVMLYADSMQMTRHEPEVFGEIRHYWEEPLFVMDLPFFSLKGADLSPLERRCFDVAVAHGIDVVRENTLQDAVDGMRDVLRTVRNTHFARERNRLSYDDYQIAQAMIDMGLMDAAELEGIRMRPPREERGSR